MITESELKISNESYTHKDFYQIYPEILDLVKKITNKWDPAGTNEADPGVVLLKLLAFVADKINYNIDKNILECFMASATQEDSMRKLCDMMGYHIKYYESAVVDVSFSYIGPLLPKNYSMETPRTIEIPRFAAISDESGDNNFVLIEPVQLNYKHQIVSKPAIEGQLVEFSINDDNIVKFSNLDDNNRLYFPESKIAENGIWIQNVDDYAEVFWEKAENNNLNSYTLGSKVWKFGYDSKRRCP